MAKRVPTTSNNFMFNSAKKPKLTELQKSSLSTSQLLRVSSSIQYDSNERINSLNNDLLKTQESIGTFLKDQNAKFNDLASATEFLRKYALKLEIDVTSDQEIYDVCKQLANVFWFMKLNSKIKRAEDVEFFSLCDYAYKTAQLFSEQYFINRRKFDEVTHSILDKKEYISKEANIDARLLVAHIAEVAKKSKPFCEFLLTQEINGFYNLPKGEKQTIIELICDKCIHLINDAKNTIRNLGLITAMTKLLENISLHYGKFDDLKNVDKGMDKLLTFNLNFATYDIDEVLYLSEVFCNISKHHNRLDFLKILCISSPAYKNEYSNRYRLHKFDMSGCKFQIFFSMCNHVFRLYEDVPIEGGNYQKLITLLSNFNILAYGLMGIDEGIQFLTTDRQTLCSCYRFFLASSMILVNVLVRNLKFNPEYSNQSIAAFRDGIIVMNEIIGIAGNGAGFSELKFPALVMNEICYYAIEFNNNVDRMPQSTQKKRLKLTTDFHDDILKHLKQKCNDEVVPVQYASSSVKKANGDDLAKELATLLGEMTLELKADESTNHGFKHSNATKLRKNMQKP